MKDNGQMDNHMEKVFKQQEPINIKGTLKWGKNMEKENYFMEMVVNIKDNLRWEILKVRVDILIKIIFGMDNGKMDTQKEKENKSLLKRIFKIYLNLQNTQEIS